VNYDVEPWYKLYIRESTEDKVLSVLNRSLRDHLLRYAKSRKDPTVLGCTDSPSADLARALGAHASEFDLIVGFVDSMLSDGYLSHRKRRLFITNFVKAQEARSPGARRQKTYREKEKASRNAKTTPQETEHNEPSTSDVTSNGGSNDEKRREETRREEDPPPPSEPKQTRPRPKDPLGDGLTGRRTQDDPGVIAVFEAWKLAHEFKGAKFRQPADFRADILFDAVQTHGVTDCLRVIEASKTDPKVLGKTDENGEEHRSIEYLFKPATFDRLLRAAEKAAAERPMSVAEATRQARMA
jgi:hypothetical protein